MKAKLILVMFFSIAVAACGGGGGGGGGDNTVQVYSGISLTGANANGVTLSGQLIAPVTVGTHTYYYWDASGDGTSAGVDYVTHDLLDQLFNGGTLGDHARDTMDASGNIVTLSNGTRIHLLTTAELSALSTAKGVPAGWGSSWYASASQGNQNGGAIDARPGTHEIVNLSSGNSGPGFIDSYTYNFFVAFEVLGAASANISATATTTAQNLRVDRAMSGFSPLTPSGGAEPYTYSYSGTLPWGLNFSTSTGAVTGTPYAPYATANLVFSVKDANNVVASTTSTVSFTVSGTGAGTGVTFSGNLGGFYSIADTNTYSYNNGVGPFVSVSGTNRTYLWSEVSGVSATGVYMLTTNSQALFSFSTDTTYWIYCGVDSSYGTYPLCSSIGVTFDKAAGRVTFASTPFVFYGSSISTGITATGSLSFPPF